MSSVKTILILYQESLLFISSFCTRGCFEHSLCFQWGAFCFALFVCYIFVFHFILSPQIEALIKCYEGRRLCFALFFIILWVREQHLLSIKQPESFQQLVMQLEFLELSPRLPVQNQQITAGRISLLGCLRHRSKWPLKSLPCRDRCGGGRNE